MLAVLCALVLAATPAFADAPADLDASARGDAAASHGFAFDTGQVLGAGQVGISARTVADRGTDLAATVGLGGGLELSVDGLDGIGFGEPNRFEWLGGELRMQLASGRRYAVSIAASYHATATTLDVDCSNCAHQASGESYSASADAVVMATRRLMISAGLGASRMPDDVGDDETFFSGHVDGTFALWSHLKVLAELGELHGAFAVLGARFATRHFSADLGVGVAGESSEVGALLTGPVAVFALSARL